MTDQHLIEAVLKSCGWKKVADEEIDGTYQYYQRGKKKMGLFDAAKILTSLDACYEVFEKDAPDEYWFLLAADFVESVEYIGEDEPHTRLNYAKFAKATPRQRCLAWLKFKGVEGV